MSNKLLPVPACAECGMVLLIPTEYHPFAACLMYKQTKNAGTVRDNLAAVLAHRQRIATLPEVDEACGIALTKRVKRRNCVSRLTYYTPDGTRVDMSGGFQLEESAEFIFRSLPADRRDALLDQLRAVNADLKAKAAEQKDLPQ